VDLTKFKGVTEFGNASSRSFEEVKGLWGNTDRLGRL
jgi:hypothetical protein